MFGVNRYDVLARRNDNDRWTDWTKVDNYQKALEHMQRAEDLGYQAKIVVTDAQVNVLFDLLDDMQQVDTVLDAGFRNQRVLAKDIYNRLGGYATLSKRYKELTVPFSVIVEIMKDYIGGCDD